MALVDHCHGGLPLKVVIMATGVQHDVLKKRIERPMSKLQTEGTRKIAVTGM